jgi:hypothetical protein
MALSKEPARKLKSREIAKIIGGVFGGMVDLSGSQACIDALDHFIHYRNDYVSRWREMSRFFESADFPQNITESDNPPPAGEKDD